MAKKNRKSRRSAQPGIPQATRPARATTPAQAETVTPRIMDEEAGAFSREGVESIVVAILLALMFRAFEAEAFVIPTGSMAPTLRGRHKDVECPQCGEQWQTGDSLGAQMQVGPVSAVTCPLCRYPHAIDKRRANDSSFSGDRILVNKFAYQIGDPERWDVIVFKFPGNAKQNYIKRLVGLPNETLRVRGGDVFVKQPGESDFLIARKPPSVMMAMLQPIFDSEHVPESLIEADWPNPWISDDDRWQSSDDRQVYSFASKSPANAEPSWLNYRHLPLTSADWKFVERGGLPPGIRTRQGQLVSDFYAYNSAAQDIRTDLRFPDMRARERSKQDLIVKEEAERFGKHWVGDLAVEFTAKLANDDGQLYLRLAEGGRLFTCLFDVASGQAELGLSDGNFLGEETQLLSSKLVADTPVKQAGTYRLRFSNIDEQLRVWVNDDLVQFVSDDSQDRVPSSGAYTSFDPVPFYSEDEPGDLHPVRIGCDGVDIQVSKVRLLRDIYYTAQRPDRDEYANSVRPNQIKQMFTSPEMWNDAEMFAFAPPGTGPRRGRTSLEFQLEEDQFFPMGDNSPASKDARLWSTGERSLHISGLVEPGAYVDRSLLIGKAFLVYWPHPWYVGNIKTPIPFVPNIGAMGRIR